MYQRFELGMRGMKASVKLEICKIFYLVLFPCDKKGFRLGFIALARTWHRPWDQKKFFIVNENFC